MSAATRKPVASNTMASGTPARRPSRNLPPRASSPVGRDPSPSGPMITNAVGGSAAIKSPSGVSRPNRASIRRPGHSTSNIGTFLANGEDNGTEEDARIENAALIDNLKKSLRNAEFVSEEYRRELGLVQKNLEEVMRDHAKLETKLHEKDQRIEELEIQKRDHTRQLREMNSVYEGERMAMLRDREEQLNKESEHKATIQRLKETLAGREMRVNADAERRMSRSGRTHSRSSSVDENGSFAPPSSMQRRGSSLQRSDSQSASRLAMQKDMVIESLRLELAEAQIKLVEMENMGGDRMHELERTLLETRMMNARLTEDNESFQLLLGEKTLNGDFTKNELMQGPAPTNGTSVLGSLAEELESVEGESENYRRLEAETKALKDQNKALTLYIEKIISRLLEHDGLEAILDQRPESAPKGNNKALPPPPKDESAAPSVLQRAMSVVGPRRSRPASQIVAAAPQPSADEATPKARPQSQIFSSAPVLPTKANEDQYSAPRIPLHRTGSLTGGRAIGHRRTQSEKSDIITPPNVAAVVNQMYRGPSGSGGHITPTSPGGTTPKTSYFAPNPTVSTQNPSSISQHPRPTSNPRTASASHSSNPPNRHERINSSSNSAYSRSSGEVPSPPRNSAGNTQYTGAVMAQSKLRPLRLVQENRADEGLQRRGSVKDGDEEARKKGNRGSWMGWWNKGKDEPGPSAGGRSVSAGNVLPE